jgi:hypothetical protein
VGAWLRQERVAAPDRVSGPPLDFASWRRGRAGVLRPLVRPAWQPVAASILALLIVAGGVVGFTPSARDAVAGWLGLRGVQIRLVPSPPSATFPVPPTQGPLGSDLGLGLPVTIGRARTLAAYRVLAPTDPVLGSPDGVYESPTLPGGLVSFVYGPRPGFPAHPDGVGLLFMEFRAKLERKILLFKNVGPGTQVRAVRVGGDPGFWLAGAPHELVFVGPNGEPFPESVRLSANVLIWQHGDLVLRIEGAGTLSAARRIAASIR